jgi:glucosamine kinase
VTSDAEAARIGAHGIRDGAIIVIGTGSIGRVLAHGRRCRVGGWGLSISGEGSGAWLGLKAVRRVLLACDGRIEWSPLLAEIFDSFGRDPNGIVRWAAMAKPADYGRFAPSILSHARCGDPAGDKLVRRAAAHIDASAWRLIEATATPISLVGGLAAHVEPYLAHETRMFLVPAQGDALAGALRIAADATAAQVAE